MGLFTAFVLVAAMVAFAVWWGYRSWMKRLPPMVDIPEIEPPRIDIGKMDPRHPVDPFSGEPLQEERGLVTLEDLAGNARDFRVNPDTAATFSEKGLRPFRDPMERLYDDPGELYCICGKHRLGIVDEISVAFLFDEIFGGYGGNFRNAFDDLEAHWFRRAAEYGYEYKLEDPLRGLKLKLGLDEDGTES